MLTKSAAGVAAVSALCSAMMLMPGAQAATPCEALIAASFPDARATSAVSVPGPSFLAPNGQSYDGLPPFCRVTALSTPSPDSLINIEVWMPTSAWNHRFVGTGNGGYAGTIAVSVPTMIDGLKLGFAVASSDMGTAPSSNNDADALVGHPEKWVDWGWRSTHLMTVVSKEIVNAFYAETPRFSYFDGCSTGGEQALMEAQRFPTDYNGILGGDPANNRTHVHTALVWVYAATHRTPGSLFTSGDTNLITNSVLAACNVKSGGLQSDPFLTDPRACTWQPSEIQCKSPTDSNCLSPDKVAAANAIYAGPTNPSNGHLIFPGSVKGTENAPLFRSPSPPST